MYNNMQQSRETQSEIDLKKNNNIFDRITLLNIMRYLCNGLISIVESHPIII